MERAKLWAKEFHFDYLTSLAVATDDADAAAKIGQYIVVAQCSIHDCYKKFGNWGSQAPPKAWSFMHKTSFDQISQAKGFTRVSGDWVSIREELKPAMIHARNGGDPPISSSYLDLPV